MMCREAHFRASGIHGRCTEIKSCDTMIDLRKRIVPIFRPSLSDAFGIGVPNVYSL